MAFKDYPMTMIWTALLFVCVIGFVIGLGGQYGKSGTDMTGGYVELGGVQGLLNNVTAQSAPMQQSFQDDAIVGGGNIITDFGNLLLNSVWMIGKTLWAGVYGFAVLFVDMLLAIGIPSIVGSTILAVLIIGLIFAVWRWIKWSD